MDSSYTLYTPPYTLYIHPNQEQDKQLRAQTFKSRKCHPTSRRPSLLGDLGAATPCISASGDSAFASTTGSDVMYHHRNSSSPQRYDPYKRADGTEYHLTHLSPHRGYDGLPPGGGGDHVDHDLAVPAPYNRYTKGWKYIDMGSFVVFFLAWCGLTAAVFSNRPDDKVQ